MGVQINGSEGNVIATKGTYSGNVTIGGTLTYEDVTNIDSVGLVTARSGIEIGARPGVAASISVDGNMIVSGISTFNDKVLLGTTTPGDSTADDLTIATSGSTGITIRTGTTNQGNIYFADGTAGTSQYAGLISYNHNTNHMFFGTNDGTERLRITGIGSVGINATNPNALLEVRGTAGTYTNATTVFSGNTTHSGSNAKNGIALHSFGDALAGGLSSNLLYSNSSSPSQSYATRSSGEITFSNTTSSSQTSLIKIGGYYKGTTDFIERVRIASDGKIGIGTINPAKAIQVGSAVTTAQFQINPHAAGWDLGVTSGDLAPHFQTKFSIYSGQLAAGVERFRVDASGAVTKPTQPRFWARSNSQQTLNSDGTTMIRDFGNEIFDTGGCYDGTNKFTAPVNGYYHFGWHIMVEGGNANTHTYLFGRPTINGNDQQQEVMVGRSGGANYASIVASHLFYLTAGQYVQIQMRQSGGSNITVRSDQGYFWGYLAN